MAAIDQRPTTLSTSLPHAARIVRPRINVRRLVRAFLALTVLVGVIAALGAASTTALTVWLVVEWVAAIALWASLVRDEDRKREQGSTAR